MFSVEFKINGAEICRIYGRNVTAGLPELDTYIWEYYHPEQPLRIGEVKHKRDTGILPLAQLIINDILKQQKRNKCRKNNK